MRILLIESGQPAVEKEINGSLQSMQEIVGGTIQAIYPFEDPVALICNDEGKLLGLPLNRALYDEACGNVCDVVVGTFFVCGAPVGAEDFTSLTDEQMEKYKKRFDRPEPLFWGRTMKIPNKLSERFDTQAGRKKLIDRCANSQAMFCGINDEGETVYLSISEQGMVLKTEQGNGWVRVNYYDAEGAATGESYDGRWRNRIE